MDTTVKWVVIDGLECVLSHFSIMFAHTADKREGKLFMLNRQLNRFSHGVCVRVCG